MRSAHKLQSSPYRMELNTVPAAFIYSIAELPVPPSSDLKLNHDEETLLLIHKLKYKALSLFLRWIRIGEPQSELLLLPEIQGYEPLARFWDSFLDLVIEFHPRTEDELIRAFVSPARLWYSCILLVSDNAFKQALAAFPTFRFKREATKNARDCLKFLNDVDQLIQLKLSSQRAESIEPVDPAKHKGGTLMAWILLQAGQYAATDPDFDRKYYRPCLRAFKKLVSSAHENKDLQMVYIDLERQLSWTSKFKKKNLSTEG
jgi:hypothetical protein